MLTLQIFFGILFYMEFEFFLGGLLFPKEVQRLLHSFIFLKVKEFIDFLKTI